MDEFDGAWEVARLQVLQCGGAALLGARAQEDVVGAFGEELVGEFEADAAVCWNAVSIRDCIVESRRIYPRLQGRSPLLWLS